MAKTPSDKEPEQPSADQTSGRELLVIVGVFALVIAAIFFGFQDISSKKPPGNTPSSPPSQPVASAPSTSQSTPTPEVASPRVLFSTDTTNYWDPNRQALYWWDEPVDSIKSGAQETYGKSNIRKSDFAGSSSCRECHPTNHKNWSSHSHRFMNAMATPDTVKGNFSGGASIDYLGGKGTFYREGGAYRMALERDDVRRVFSVERTIGSRFTQYYVGRLLEGPDSENDPRREIEHVLPFGYWFDRKEWVPTVHVFRDEDADHETWDPYADLKFTPYDRACGDCHTTLPAGDRMIRSAGLDRLSEYGPREVSFEFYKYLAENHPDKAATMDFKKATIDDVASALDSLTDYPIPEQGVELGVSCEACHFGAKAHAENSDHENSNELPAFFPLSPNFHVAAANRDEAFGRNAANLNYTCAKCHSGGRPEYASGHHTWNSTEYADAVRGACYDSGDQLPRKRTMTCVHCHDPHKSVGQKWRLTPKEDDAKCLDCHQQFVPASARTAHTHHPIDSPGSRCMNCHMPKINEGLQEMVRTHRIFSPTEPRMIEANQPNACNLCHLDQPIDWTIKHLQDWYGSEHEFSETELSKSYPDRQGPVGAGWLKSPHEATRLAAAGAMAAEKHEAALPALLDLLIEDPFLVNRQFTQRDLEDWLGFSLRDAGYQFYMTEPNRRAAVEQIRADAQFQKLIQSPR